jgi:hypothetical protein
MPAPRRFRVFDSLARPRTLNSGKEAFERLLWAELSPVPDEGAPLLFLGLGPGAEELARGAPETAFVECPDFEEGLARAGTGTAFASPGWKRLSPEEIGVFLAERGPAVWAYRQARLLFPDFWGPLWGRLRAASLGNPRLPPAPSARAAPPPVLLPCPDHGLLRRELDDALAAEGFFPYRLPASARGVGPDLLRALRGDKPAFFLSVNLRGLDPEGEVFHLLRAMDVPVAVWFVDNPWHILSSLRLPWWKEAFLFATGAGFIPELKEHGAKRAFFLPLAASPLFAAPSPAPLPPSCRVFFAGSSAFPRKAAFFAASRPPLLLEEKAAALPSPDFHWWTAELGLEGRLWPGSAVRGAGAGAEAASLRRRAAWLRAAAPLGLALAGGAEWKNLLADGAGAENVVFLPPADYYDDLPGLYRAAPYSLNVTSLLLPGGLTQRHFDVWQAGGFLLTDHSAGLGLFPPELVEPIAPRRPGELAAFMENLERQPSLRRDVSEAWRELLAKAHTYRHRMRFLIQCLETP